MNKAIKILKSEIAQRKLALSLPNLREKETQEELDSLEKVLIKISPSETDNKKYSVSLVYWSSIDTLLRVLITDAVSEDEALGKSIKYFKKETKNYSLSLHTVIQLNQ
jgi:hypothetical protein